jgi:hypothetical protein
VANEEHLFSAHLIFGVPLKNDCAPATSSVTSRDTKYSPDQLLIIRAAASTVNRNGFALLGGRSAFRVRPWKGYMPMTIKTFFTIVAVLALVHGAGFVVVPEQVAPVMNGSIGFNSAYGATVRCSSGGIRSNLLFARDGSSESLRSLFIATIVGNTVGLIVVVMGTAAGTLNSMGWIAALIYLFGAAGSGYFITAIVSLKFLFSLRRDGLIRLKLRIDSRLRAAFSCRGDFPVLTPNRPVVTRVPALKGTPDYQSSITSGRRSKSDRNSRTRQKSQMHLR